MSGVIIPPGLRTVTTDGTTITGTGVVGDPLVFHSSTPLGNDPRFGPGLDGSVTLDGSTTVLGMVPSGNVYTATRDLTPINLTINNGVKLFMSNWGLQVAGTLTNNGTIHCNGTDAGVVASGGAAIPGVPSGRFSGSEGSGQQAAGGTVSHVPRLYFTAGAGGTPSSGAGHAGTGDGGAGGDSTVIGGGVGRAGGATVLCTHTQALSLHDLWHGYLQVWVSGPFIQIEVLQFGGAAGGAGGGGSASGPAGPGGGMLWVAARTLAGTGLMQARGGAGGITSFGGGSAGGGGGGGGMVLLMYGTRSGTQTIDANGGIGGVGTNGCTNGGNGGSGAVYLLNLSGDGT